MNIFKQFFVSLYSPQEMAKFRFQSIGKTILYIILITIVSIIPFSKLTISGVKTGLATMTMVIDEQIPPFKIENGQLFADEDEPIIIKENDFTIIFDSNDQVKAHSLRNETNALAILKHEFIIVADGNVQETTYKSLAPLTISGEDISFLLSQLNNNTTLLSSAIILGIFIISSIAKFIDIFVLAIFGLLLRNITSQQLQYRQLWTLSAYAVTIPTVFFTIMNGLQTTVPAGFLINWGVSLLLLFLILKEVQNATPPQQT